MAVSGGEEEAEYESDPEESMPLGMRRREASDDDGDGEDREKPPRADPRTVVCSDAESDGQGGAPAYDEEESELEEEEEEEEEMEEEEEVEEIEEEEEEEYEERRRKGGHDAGELDAAAAVADSGVEGRRSGTEPLGFRGKNQPEEEKKENEPFAVPTAGAFYMHDDRFRDNGGGRHRRTPGGRKLWESKDDQKWGHDKFEEMTMQEAHYEEERRTLKGRNRGRGRNRAMDRGYTRRNRSRAYENDNNHNHTARSVRGRGPRRYEPPPKNSSEVLPTQNKQSRKSTETASNTSPGGRPFTQAPNVPFTQAPNAQPDSAPPRKNVFASNLNSASPPFYPSSSSNQDISITQKRDVQSGNTNRSPTSSVLMDENLSAPHSSALLCGKTVSDPIGQDHLYIDESARSVSGKLANLQLHTSGVSTINSTQQLPQSRAQGRGISISGQLNYQPTPSFNQVNRVPAQPQISSVQPRPIQIPVQPSLRSTQQLGQRPGSGSQAASPPKAPSRDSPEPGETELSPESSKLKTALVGKGKSSGQGSGRGSFLYGGAQVIGAHGDQSFPATPALLPVMQFGGQHPGGLGVPAVGMALPGYVSQPQLGFGNSEMAWVPVLAGAAGALGATYCSPYIAVDGGYYARPSGQTSSMSGSGNSLAISVQQRN
ncbi:PREDICTED: protein CASC3-like isoform X2 [Nelumbo nucifera]|uniref:Protein CASC3-like isoform X2 n=1 Tax=Nelumbo nucifera TaxID=4432 RepID=A0A1U7ZMQ0_NELNU|nr:PREDICTED: protein CASC3-like isoform X2 [Nelumbo nucifera]